MKFWDFLSPQLQSYNPIRKHYLLEVWKQNTQFVFCLYFHMQPALFFHITRTDILEKSFYDLFLPLSVFYHKDLSKIYKYYLLKSA